MYNACNMYTSCTVIRVQETVELGFCVFPVSNMTVVWLNELCAMLVYHMNAVQLHRAKICCDV